MLTDDMMLLAAFPFILIGLWLFSTTVFGFMSGWFSLQQWYEPPLDKPLLKLRGQSGSMGIGVSFERILILGVYRNGLGIGIWRIFGPFQRPFLIPWNQIEATPSKTFLTRVVKLELGKPVVGKLTISARCWSKLVKAAGPLLLSPGC